MKSRFTDAIARISVALFASILLSSVALGATQKTVCDVSNVTLPPNTVMLNTSLTTGLLLVQFSDWQTNVDARGSVGYVDNNGDGQPDVIQFNKYRYGA